MEQAVSEESARVAIAAIDVDGTLFSERAAQHVFLGILRSSGLLGRAAFARLVAIYVGHRVGLIDPVSARVRGLAVLDGLPLERAEALADKVVADLLDVVRPEARAEIAALRAGGAYVLLVSASLSLIVSRLSAGLGADGYLASELLVHGDTVPWRLCRAGLRGAREMARPQPFCRRALRGRRMDARRRLRRLDRRRRAARPRGTSRRGERPRQARPYRPARGLAARRLALSGRRSSGGAPLLPVAPVRESIEDRSTTTKEPDA